MSHSAVPLVVVRSCHCCCHANEQVLGIHLGIHHLSANTYYTPDAFKQAAMAVHEEDQMWTSRSDPYMAQCPRTFEAISMWK